MLGQTLVTDVGKGTTPADQLAIAATAFVRFAASHRALYETLFAAGLDKTKKELAIAAQPIEATVVAPAQAVCRDEADAQELVIAVIATAHGFAGLFLDGAFGSGERAVAQAAAHTARASLALVTGWSAPRPSTRGKR